MGQYLLTAAQEAARITLQGPEEDQPSPGPTSGEVGRGIFRPGNPPRGFCITQGATQVLFYPDRICPGLPSLWNHWI